jgi:hypothetical protein
MRKIPLSEVYGTGVNLDIDTGFYDDINHWQPTDNIPWEHGITVEQTQREALATVATQFHFGKMTDMKLCGRVLEHEPDMHAKRLALLLANSRIRTADAWGRYLGLLESTGTILPPLDTYMSAMYDDTTDPVSLLIGMVMVGDISGHVILDAAMQTDEPVLRAMGEQMMEQATQNRENAVFYLRSVLGNIPPNRFTKIRHDVQRYRQNLDDILLTQEDAFTTLGWDTTRITERATNESDQFLDSITPQN